MSTPEPFGLRLLRRSATKDYSVTVLPSEAADVVAEVEHLRAQVAELRALGVSLHKAADAGAQAERAAVVAWLKKQRIYCTDSTGGPNAVTATYAHAAEAVERGEHLREEKE